MRSSRAAIAAALTSLVLVPALAACSSDSSASGSATTAAAGAATAAATDPAHSPLNKPEDLKVLDGITVAGDDPAVTPKVTIASPPVSVSATAEKTLKEGTGDASVGGDTVTVRQALFLGKDGTQLQSDFETKSTASFIRQGTDTIPGLITALTGV